MGSDALEQQDAYLREAEVRIRELRHALRLQNDPDFRKANDQASTSEDPGLTRQEALKRFPG